VPNDEYRCVSPSSPNDKDLQPEAWAGRRTLKDRNGYLGNKLAIFSEAKHAPCKTISVPVNCEDYRTL